MDEVIEAIEDAFQSFYRGSTYTPQRTSVKIGEEEGGYEGQILYMPCLLEPSSGENVIGLKLYTEFPDNKNEGLPISHAAILLFDGSNGIPSVFMEGMYPTGLRTGATSAVAGQYLLPENPGALGLIGAGFQGFFQVWAISTVRNFEEIGIYDPSPEQMETLSSRLRNQLNLDVVMYNSSKALVESSNVLVTATSSTEPVFDSTHLQAGATVFAIGSYNPDSRELDTHLMQNSELYVDSREAALQEAGDLIIPIKSGDLSKENINGDLAQLVSGEIPGRSNRRGVYVFKAVGLAFEDMAVARLAYKRAVKEGLGTDVDLLGSAK